MTSTTSRRGRALIVALPVIGAAIVSAALAWTPASAASCQPVRKYVYTLPAAVALSCSPAAVTVFDIDIPDRGRFLVRANLRMRGTGTVPERVHGWSARWSKLGDPGFPRKIAFAAGEDVCTGETRNKGMLGFGKLDAANHRVSLAMNAYRTTDCEDAAVTVGAGSSLELWVEDPSPSCQGRDIAVVSDFNLQATLYQDWKDHTLAIDAKPRSVVQGSIRLTGPVRRLDIIGQTEISPSSTVNTCGQRSESGAAWLHVNGASIVGGNQTDTYPPSGGMTHLLLDPSVSVTPGGPGLYRFGLAASVSQAGEKPAIVGTHVSGDSIVAAVASRRPPRSHGAREARTARTTQKQTAQKNPNTHRDIHSGDASPAAPPDAAPSEAADRNKRPERDPGPKPFS